MKKLQTLLFALMMLTVSLAGCTDLSNQVDLDNDTVVDADDLCPDTDPQLTVDLNGCADNQLDDDGDLVMNDVDLCPNTPAGAVVDATGCELPDTDEDGITDADDLCPDTDVGATVDANGCADNQLDDDGDGVMNDVDICPLTPTEVTVDTEGCHGGSVITWGDSGYGGNSSSVSTQLSSRVIEITSSGWTQGWSGPQERAAFAALKSDGSVVTWGGVSYGGDSSAVSSQINSGVEKIYSNWGAFAALKFDGSVVTWGHNDPVSYTHLTLPTKA